jgi:hypothetical protein
MQSMQAYATGPQVPPGRTTPYSYATAKEKKKRKKINVTVIVFLLKKSIDVMLFVSFIHSLFYHIHHDV